MLVQQLRREETVGFVDLWGCFIGRADMYMRAGLHLSGNCTAVFVDELCLGSINNIFGNKHCLN